MDSNENSVNSDNQDSPKKTVKERGMSQTLDKLVKQDGQKNNLKNLYQNIGTRVSKLKEINEIYQQKMANQNKEINHLDDMIREKEALLEKIHEAKAKGDNEFFKNIAKDPKLNLNMEITINHVKNDPELNKLIKNYEKKCGDLKDKLNNLYSQTEYIRSDINTLRLENSKINQKLDQLTKKKEWQTSQMDMISEEANNYLKEKGKINKELIELNEKIDNQKQVYDSKMQELNKMIDNTKKIKEFHETLAYEKFAKSNFRKTFSTSTSQEPTNRISEEEKKLEEINKQLKKKKRTTAYLNFSRIILLKKQKELNEIIEKIKSQTGIENLDKLSEYLDLSTKTNKLFETDIKNLNEQKIQIEEKIDKIKKEIQESQSILMDTSTKKFQHIQKLKEEKMLEEENKEKMNKKLYCMNRIIEIMSNAFRDSCIKLKCIEPQNNMEAENNENMLMTYMDLLEKKLVEIIQFYSDPLKEEEAKNENEEEELKNAALLEKIISKIHYEDINKFVESKKMQYNSNLKDLNPEELINHFKRKFDL